jgi:hypothetical protein
MRSAGLFLLAVLMLATSGTVSAADDSPLLDNSKVAPLTKFLEEQPLHKDAPVIRAALLQWEDASKDVVDVVCPPVLAPLPNKSIKYSGELIAQFIFGSAAYQLTYPSEKGKLQPAQLAGMRSLLKAYRSIIAQDSKARVPRFDELVQSETDGSLPKVMEALVTASCKG